MQNLALKSADFSRFIKDPTISREQKAAALASISSQMKLSELTSNFIGALPLRQPVKPHLARRLSAAALLR